MEIRIVIGWEVSIGGWCSSVGHCSRVDRGRDDELFWSSHDSVHRHPIHTHPRSGPYPHQLLAIFLLFHHWLPPATFSRLPWANTSSHPSGPAEGSSPASLLETSNTLLLSIHENSFPRGRKIPHRVYTSQKRLLGTAHIIVWESFSFISTILHFLACVLAFDDMLYRTIGVFELILLLAFQWDGVSGYDLLGCARWGFVWGVQERHAGVLTSRCKNTQFIFHAVSFTAGLMRRWLRFGVGKFSSGTLCSPDTLNVFAFAALVVELSHSILLSPLQFSHQLQ